MADGGAAPGRVLPERAFGRHTFAHEHVLAWLAAELGGSRGAVVSKRACAEALSMSAATVDAALLGLRRRGLVEALPRHAADGGQLANEYRLTREGAARAAALVLRAYGATRGTG